MAEREAADALEHLGLTRYEARVFVALHQLGSGTALEIQRVSDVPRSQVYGTAERLQERGLVEIQQSSPKRYRPVSLEAARAQLAARFDRQEARAFESLERLRQQPADPPHEEVSTLRGTEPIHERVASLIDRCERRVVFGAPTTTLVSETIRERIHDRAAAGVDAIVVSDSEAVRGTFDPSAVTVHAPPAVPAGGFSGRVLLGDDGIVLVSVGPEGDGSGAASELALWTADTGIGRILVRFLWTGLQAFLEQDDRPVG